MLIQQSIDFLICQIINTHLFKKKIWYMFKQKNCFCTVGFNLSLVFTKNPEGNSYYMNRVSIVNFFIELFK